jgi:hypothetical protein
MSKFGVGVCKEEIPEIQRLLITRPKNQIGLLIFDEVFDLEKVAFKVGSGSSKYYGCPYGTYLLSKQEIASSIARLYRIRHIGGNRLFNTVWNVGTPDDITSTGFDPAVKRKRKAIQIHSDTVYKSMGCVVLLPGDFIKFQTMINKIDDGQALIGIEIKPGKIPIHPLLTIIKVETDAKI